jgi:hypothetical protein
MFYLIGLENLVNYLALMKIGVCGDWLALHEGIYWRTLDGRNVLVVFRGES